MSFKTYIVNIIVALDQVGTTLVGGWPDETMSSYAHRMREQSKPWGFIADLIDWFALKLFGQYDHCYHAYLNERARAQLPPGMRGLG